MGQFTAKLNLAFLFWCQLPRFGDFSSKNLCNLANVVKINNTCLLVFQYILIKQLKFDIVIITAEELIIEPKHQILSDKNCKLIIFCIYDWERVTPNWEDVLVFQENTGSFVTFV